VPPVDVSALVALVQQQGAQIQALMQQRAAPPATPPPAAETAPDPLASVLDTKRAELAQYRYAAQHGTAEQQQLAARAIPRLEADVRVHEMNAELLERVAALEAAPGKTQAEQAARTWVQERLRPEVLSASGYPRLAAAMTAGHVKPAGLLAELDIDGFDPARAGETIAPIDRQLRLLEMVAPDPTAIQATTPATINPGAIKVPANGTPRAATPEPAFQDGDWKQRLAARMRRTLAN
jgi:hypothetical protein